MSRTPILDLEQPPPVPASPWLPRLVGIAIGSGIALLLILGDQDRLPRLGWPGFNGLLLVPAFYAAIAVHEFGHLLAAKLAGIGCGGIGIGGFVLLRSGRNWMFRFDRHRWICGGFFKPLTHVPVAVSQYAWMVAGGPLASIAFSAIAWSFWRLDGDGVWRWTGSLFWIAVATMCLSAIPFSSGLNRSDGARLWQLLRHPESAPAWMALLNLQTQEALGVRPRDWNTDNFERALVTDAGMPEYPYCQLLAFYRRLDEQDWNTALHHLENALARSKYSGIVFRHLLYLEAAAVSANIFKQAAQARVWRDRACRLLKRPELLLPVDAGIAMCEGQFQIAADLWDAARKQVVRRNPDSGLARFTTEKWLAYTADCRRDAAAKVT